MSPVVHALPQLQGLVLLVLVQPLAGLQLPSLQLRELVRPQAPPLQASVVVQALPSLQGLTLLIWTQPLAGLQLSSVHVLPSLQLRAPLPLHVPPAQTSVVVQALLSLHGAL